MIVVMMRNTEGSDDQTSESVSMTASIHDNGPGRPRTVDLDWLVVPAWRCWRWQVTGRPSGADDSCQSEDSRRYEHARP